MKREVKIAKYRHFKGDIVEVLYIGLDSETLKRLVIYDHNNQIWVRDYDEFLSLVDKNKYPNVKQEYRFELIEEL